MILLFPLQAKDWEADWKTIDGGGEILMSDPSESTGWEVSGTIGQWDSTQLKGSAAGIWEVTGGFWSATVLETDYLFSDGFESTAQARRPGK